MKCKLVTVSTTFLLVSSPSVANDDFKKLFSESHLGIESAVIKVVEQGKETCAVLFNKKKDKVVVGFEASDEKSKITVMGIKSKSDSAEIKLNGYKYKGVTLPLDRSGDAYIGEMPSIMYWDQKPVMYVGGRYVELPNINSYGFSSSISAYDDCIARSYSQ